uniref:Uncharacterized protein n=1 Tax=Arundo donax TaxID=35708 RepID=A0A0A9D6K1_ARUDO
MRRSINARCSATGMGSRTGRAASPHVPRRIVFYGQPMHTRARAYMGMMVRSRRHRHAVLSDGWMDGQCCVVLQMFSLQPSIC